MAVAIEFHFDLLSPYAYLAHTQLPALAARYGAALAYRPIDLAQAKQAVGNTGPTNREMPVKHRHLRLDLQRWAAHYGVPLVPPAGYGSLRLNCGALYALDREQPARYVEAAWRRVWGEGSAMDDGGLLLSLAGEMGWPADDFMAYVSSDAAHARLRAATEQASARGVFGVPTMFVGDQMWWGNDRLHFLEQYLQSQMAA